MSLDDLYNHLKVYEAEVQKKPNSNPQNMAFISSSRNSNNEDGNTVCVTTATTKVACFNCHKMGHFARECRAPRNQERVRKESYRQGSKAKEKSSKALMAIDGVGWDWSYMANKEDHALVADGETP
nr:hypothetical protein [Tanacetum cinerariifolium]